MLKFSKLSVKFNVSRLGNANSVFLVPIIFKRMNFIVNPNPNRPCLSWLVKIHSLVTRCVVFSGPYIHHVLGFSRFSQIAPTIIKRILIDVINLMNGPSASHHGPNYPMGSMQLAVDSHRDASLAICGAAGNIAYISSSASKDFPRQNARFWIIIKNAAQLFGVNLFHQVNLPGDWLGVNA